MRTHPSERGAAAVVQRYPDDVKTELAEMKRLLKLPKGQFPVTESGRIVPLYESCYGEAEYDKGDKPEADDAELRELTLPHIGAIVTAIMARHVGTVKEQLSNILQGGRDRWARSFDSVVAVESDQTDDIDAYHGTMRYKPAGAVGKFFQRLLEFIVAHEMGHLAATALNEGAKGVPSIAEIEEYLKKNILSKEELESLLTPKTEDEKKHSEASLDARAEESRADIFGALVVQTQTKEPVARGTMEAAFGPADFSHASAAHRCNIVEHFLKAVPALD
jgi:hypothetical protein